MVFENLSDNVAGTVLKLRGVYCISEQNITGTMKQMKRAVLDGDDNLRVVNGIWKDIKARAIGADVLSGVQYG